MKTTLLSFAGLVALASMVQADSVPEDYFYTTVSTKGSKASLSGQFLNSNPAVNGAVTVKFGSTGESAYYLNDNGNLVLNPGWPFGDPVGPGYIDSADNGILKFSNHSSVGYAQFTVNTDNFELLPVVDSDHWYWCPVDGTNGTLALGPSPGDGCEEIDSITVAYSD